MTQGTWCMLIEEILEAGLDRPLLVMAHAV